MKKTPQEAREHFEAVEQVFAEAKKAVEEQERAMREDCGDVYCRCKLFADVSSVMRLYVTGIFDKGTAARTLHAIRTQRCIHPALRQQYADFIAAHDLLKELDARADRLMSAEG